MKKKVTTLDAVAKAAQKAYIQCLMSSNAYDALVQAGLHDMRDIARSPTE